MSQDVVIVYGKDHDICCGLPHSATPLWFPPTLVNISLLEGPFQIFSEACFFNSKKGSFCLEIRASAAKPLAGNPPPILATAEPQGREGQWGREGRTWTIQQHPHLPETPLWRTLILSLFWDPWIENLSPPCRQTVFNRLEADTRRQKVPKTQVLVILAKSLSISPC